MSETRILFPNHPEKYDADPLIQPKQSAAYAEAATVFTVADHRGVDAAAMFVVSDYLGFSEWEPKFDSAADLAALCDCSLPILSEYVSE